MSAYHLDVDKTMPDDVQGAVPAIRTTSEQLRLFAFEAEVNENFGMAAVYYEEVIKHLPGGCCYSYLYNMDIINSGSWLFKNPTWLVKG